MGKRSATGGHGRGANSIASAAKQVSDQPIEELLCEGQEDESAGKSLPQKKGKEIKIMNDFEDEMARTPDVINLSEVTANEEE